MTNAAFPQTALPVGIALIGCGRIATAHLEAIRAQSAYGRVVAVVDNDLDNARAFAQRFDVETALDSLEAALLLPEVEAVLICTPNALHVEQTLAALEAGRHVLLEKPFSEDVAGAERLVAAADRTGLVLAVGHTFRHVEAVRYIQDHRHEFGRLRAVSIAMLVRWDGPQASWWGERTRDQGLILSLYAPHALDFLQLVVGDDDPIRFTVEAAQHQTSWQAEDEVMIQLRYPHDVMAQVHISYNQDFVVNRKTLHFDRAMLTIDHGDTLSVNDQIVVQPAPENAGDPHTMGKRKGGHFFETQFREFALAVRGEPHRSVSPTDALRLVKLNRAIIDRAARATQADRDAAPVEHA